MVVLVGSSALVAGIGGAADAAAFPVVSTVPLRVVLDEGFEHNTVTTAVPLPSYTSATGATYTADPAWLADCNGVVISGYLSAPPTNCDTAYNNRNASAEHLMQIAHALGQIQGTGDPAANHILAGYTGHQTVPAGQTLEFASTTPMPLSAGTSAHFVGFSVNSAEGNCTADAIDAVTHAQYQFQLVNPANAAVTNVGGVIDPCTYPGTRPVDVPAMSIGGTTADAGVVQAGSFATDGALFFAGATVGVQLHNQQSGWHGNDAGIDNVKILDETPTLDSAFTPGTVQAGQTTTLTYTIHNTSDLNAKNGWSFTQGLPAGITPTGAAPVTDCPGLTVTGLTPGSSRLTLGGSLSQAQTGCTISLTLTATTAGSYATTTAITTAGVYPPSGNTVNLVVTSPPAPPAPAPAAPVVKPAPAPVHVAPRPPARRAPTVRHPVRVWTPPRTVMVAHVTYGGGGGRLCARRDATDNLPLGCGRSPVTTYSRVRMPGGWHIMYSNPIKKPTPKAKPNKSSYRQGTSLLSRGGEYGPPSVIACRVHNCSGGYEYNYHWKIGSIAKTGGAKKVMAAFQAHPSKVFPFKVTGCAKFRSGATCTLHNSTGVTPPWNFALQDTGTVRVSTTPTSVTFTVSRPGYFDPVGSKITFSTSEKKGNVYLHQSTRVKTSNPLVAAGVGFNLAHDTWAAQASKLRGMFR